MQRSLNLDGDSRPLDTQAGVKEVNENNLIYVNCETKGIWLLSMKVKTSRCGVK